MSIFNQFIPNPSQPAAGSEQKNGETPCKTEVTLKPAFELNEAPEGWNLTVQLPGVAREGLEFTAEDNLITIRGSRAWRQPEAWSSLHRESADAPYQLVFAHDGDIDLDKIQAELKDGVLKVSLPKTEAVKPRKITVN